ncbi:N-acetylglucosamine-6-phosphate deacetylase [Kineococcus terrestris]|uniref:N-acetylglucosamine-6-phosphate deacetylase n=1 Tax=Kineococcus terrestris TaxID=2044856 RepID=UPI0034DAC890
MSARVRVGAGPLVVHGARLLDGLGGPVREDGWAAAGGGRVTAVGAGGGWRAHARGAEVVDAAGAWLVPGFVDLHRHGGGGRAHEDGPDAVLAAAELHRAHGTTRGVVSFVSDDVDVLAGRLAGVADLLPGAPHLLGSHLEGPFLGAARRGAHAERHLRDPAPEAVERLVRAARGTLRQVTLDPLRPGAARAAARFLDAGAVVALGHTDAGADAARAAFDAGARLLTHAFNAVPGVHHRDPGPVPVAAADPRVVCELVLDGEHVHPLVARLLLAAAPGRVALVTDAVAAAGAADGRYRLGGVEVDVGGGRAVVAGTAVLAGSTLTQDRALRVGAAAGLALPELVRALTSVPAGALGLRDAGRLAPGALADLVLLDEHLRPVRVECSPLPAVLRPSPVR